MAEPATVATPTVSIDPDALAEAGVRVCAHTGAATNHVRSEAVCSVPRSLCFLPRSIGFWLLALFVRSTIVRVPIERRVSMSNCDRRFVEELERRGIGTGV